MRIVILDGFTSNPGDLSWSEIEKHGHVTVYPRTDEENLIQRAEVAEILVVNKRNLGKEHIQQIPHLKCICTLATGYNNIDIEFARTKGIDVCNAVGYSSPSVAQHVFAMLFQFTNNVGNYNTEVQNGTWSKSIDWTYLSSPHIELSGKNIGIYGYGKIGQQVGKIARALGMNVLVVSRGEEKDVHPDVKYLSVNDFFALSDVISLHAPLSKDNEGIICTNTISLMKKSAIIVNTGRGGLVNERDLEKALKKKTIAGACLDVLIDEPPEKNHPLIGLHNCIITPHIAWATKESRARLIDIVAQNIAAFKLGKPQNVVN